MPIESFTSISALNNLWPLGTDPKGQGDDHIRGIKTVLKLQFATGDMWFGTKTAPDMWVWNDKADGTGSNAMVLTDTGNLATAGSIQAGTTLTSIGNTAVGGSLQVTGYAQIGTTASVGTSLTVGGGGLTVGTAPNQGAIAGNGSIAAAGFVQVTGGVGAAAYPTYYFKDSPGGSLVANMLWSNTAPYERVEIYIPSGSGLHRFYYTGAMEINNTTAWKPAGGPWAATSDARIKTVLGDYGSGLDAVKALHPVRYVYMGNDTRSPPAESAAADAPVLTKDAAIVPYRNSMHYGAAVDQTEFIGLIAQEAEASMPEMVRQFEGFIDGAPVSDIRELDTGPLIFALINAVKELSARLEALEAAP